MAANDRSITGRGKRWERLHSVWVLWMFTLAFFNWVGFLYVGVRVRHRVWVAWGAVYSIPFIVIMATTGTAPLPDSIVALLTLVPGAVGIIHGFHIRPEYLRRLSERERNHAAQVPAHAFYPPGRRRHEERGPHGPTAAPLPVMPVDPPSAPAVSQAPPPAPPAAAPSPPAPQATPATLLDLNAATEGELASLPGVGVVLAKRAMTTRSQRGGFASVDEMGHALELKPHVVERLRPLVTAGSRREQSGAGRTGRLIDF